jgi:hypothetical protein
MSRQPRHRPFRAPSRHLAKTRRAVSDLREDDLVLSAGLERGLPGASGGRTGRRAGRRRLVLEKTRPGIGQNGQSDRGGVRRDAHDVRSARGRSPVDERDIGRVELELVRAHPLQTATLRQSRGGGGSRLVERGPRSRIFRQRCRVGRDARPTRRGRAAAYRSGDPHRDDEDEHEGPGDDVPAATSTLRTPRIGSGMRSNRRGLPSPPP